MKYSLTNIKYSINHFLFIKTNIISTDESEIQEVNPLKTVAPPLQPQPLNKKKAYKVKNNSLYQYTLPSHSKIR